MGWWGVSFSSAPTVRTQACVVSDKSSNALDPGNIPLAATKHQPEAVQEIRGLRRPLLAVDPAVVDVGAALPDSPPRSTLAVRQSAGHQQVDDGVGSARLEF